MRTPVMLTTGQGDTDAVTGTLLRTPGTVVVEHDFDGHVVRRTTSTLDGETTETALELTHGCIACTIRDDLLTLLHALHRHPDVTRIVVHLAPWLEPEPVCWAINHGPGARDVTIAAVITCIDAHRWLTQALSDDELEDGRTVAQVVVGQAEFADVLVLTHPHPTTLATLRRLTPRARITVGHERVEMALAHLEADARRGRADGPHDPLLAGEPPLAGDGDVQLIEFGAGRPFHPQRLHAAIDLLLDGVIRTRGRLWLATQPQQAMWIESAGGGLRIDSAGTWLAAMTATERARVDPQRRAMADLMWSDEYGDRHTSMTVLACGAHPREIRRALAGALLTDDEMAAPAHWHRYPDPFGGWHRDPCDDLARSADEAPLPRSSGGDVS